MDKRPIIVAILAHNEERRIARCLASLPLGNSDVAVHVVVNGSKDRTADIARGFAGVTVHEYPEGGKSRSWNRFVLDTPDIAARCFVFVDGDAEVLPGSVEALAAALAADPQANAASAMPRNGRHAEAYRQEMIVQHGMFGDLYALSGQFIDRMRALGIRLPEDLIGDDGLLCAMAKTDLRNEDHWQDQRVIPCQQAGFLCQPASLLEPATLLVQYRRMINYSVRHFQNRMISSIMRGEGPAGLPRRLAMLYPEWLPRFAPRRHPVWWWFDRKALARMARAAAS
ncbi:glycosyltransferase family 2 protein [Altererythrobacter sp. CC-YST694]|uniref:glycosyltransferase family A protein n=1 Tax=Altererythrobacter sp. CC-YST694 TaxID=2755038 RepID=UPI001D01B6ED|nr:glycosyltransferase family A protein [Altererythrobacter sp. CC-YST694]MCB5426600.1 glycosyltransferase family 2 protein [Altererythrobacter sp. CC-YST694]